MFGRIIFPLLCALLLPGLAGGVPAQQAATIAPAGTMQVLTPAYGSWPLLALCALGVLGLVIWLVLRRQRRRFEADLRALEHEVELHTREAETQKKMLQHLNATLRTSNGRLQELSEQKSYLLSIAAHDLKAPLTNIYSLAEILLEEQASGAPNYEFVELIRSSAREMNRLIEDVLSSAASESGQVGLHCVLADLGELAERTVSTCLGMADRKQQRVTLTLDPVGGDFTVVGDEMRLVEVMTNLVSNAVKYSPPEGEINVRVRREGEAVWFEVEDCGPGLGEGDRERLFQPFQRLSAQPTNGESSSGLGLYIVQQYVEMHGGEVDVESTPGVGSTFWFRLPAALGEAAILAASLVGAAPENRVETSVSGRRPL